MDTLKSAVNSVISAISPAAPEQSFSRAQVVALEEQERQRRIDHATQSQLDKQNARRISSIIENLPILKASPNAGRSLHCARYRSLSKCYRFQKVHS